MNTTAPTRPAITESSTAAPGRGRGPAIEAGPTGTTVRLRSVHHRIGETTLLDSVDLDLHAGELVAVAGPSGAGKSTLLRAAAGLFVPTSGTVGHPAARRPVGFVPQEDIVHRDLTVERTLRDAARLRRPDADAELVGARVEAAIAAVGLGPRRDARVGDLSGGQRKRASIAVELLGDPDVCLLDEPTSGLDPLRAAEVLESLRNLADHGVTVVLTTHAPSDLERVDRVVLVAEGGRIAFDGPPADAPGTFGVEDLTAVYPRLTRGPHPGPAGSAPATDAPATSSPRRRGGGRDARALAPPPATTRASARGALRRWMVLSRRTATLLAANRLTLAVLVASPVLVITMMTVLFPAGAFDEPGAAAATAPQLLFWMAFAGFFFGLTYGLLQIVTERDIQRRERAAGLPDSTYLAAKLTVLVPLLVLVCSALVGVLASTDRLPAMGAVDLAVVTSVVVADAIAALALGMLASAVVRDPAQATLALPMLCFPQVLFAGAMVPLPAMSELGRALSLPLATRWAFEALGRTVPLTPSTGPAATVFPDVFTGGAVVPLVILVASAAACLEVTRRLLAR